MPLLDTSPYAYCPILSIKGSLKRYNYKARGKPLASTDQDGTAKNERYSIYIRTSSHRRGIVVAYNLKSRASDIYFHNKNNPS